MVLMQLGTVARDSGGYKNVQGRFVQAVSNQQRQIPDARVE